MLQLFMNRLFGKAKRTPSLTVGLDGNATHSIIKIDNEGLRSELIFGQTRYGKGHAPSSGHKTDTVIEMSQTLVLPPSNRPKSMLDDLTPAEKTELFDWSESQPRDYKHGGSVNLMEWPGWKDVLARRCKERIGVDPTALDTE